MNIPMTILKIRTTEYGVTGDHVVVSLPKADALKMSMKLWVASFTNRVRIPPLSWTRSFCSNSRKWFTSFALYGYAVSRPGKIPPEQQPCSQVKG